MDATSIIAVVGLVVFGGLWLARRRSRMRSNSFE